MSIGLQDVSLGRMLARNVGLGYGDRQQGPSNPDSPSTGRVHISFLPSTLGIDLFRRMQSQCSIMSLLALDERMPPASHMLSVAYALLSQSAERCICLFVFQACHEIDFANQIILDQRIGSGAFGSVYSGAC